MASKAGKKTAASKAGKKTAASVVSTATSTKAVTKKKDAAGVSLETTVPEKETWTFQCARTCYWDGHLCYGTDKYQPAQAQEVAFTGPCNIPGNFQMHNWKRIS